MVMGGKEAPGATTTALALGCVWPAASRLVVEADPDGGVLAARFGAAHEPGLVSLAATRRRGLDAGAVGAHTQALGDHGLSVLPAPPLPEQSTGALAVVGRGLVDALASMDDVGVVVDVGRAWPDAPAIRPFVAGADVVLLVGRPRLEEIQQLRARWRAARLQNRRVGVVLVGQRPYSPGEVAAAVEPAEAALVVWGVLPEDALGADVLNGRRFAPAWALRKSQLLRAASTIATEAVARLGLEGSPVAPSGNGQQRRGRRRRVRVRERNA